MNLLDGTDLLETTSTEVKNRILKPGQMLRAIDTGALYYGDKDGKPTAFVGASTSSDEGIKKRVMLSNADIIGNAYIPRPISYSGSFAFDGTTPASVNLGWRPQIIFARCTKPDVGAWWFAEGAMWWGNTGRVDNAESEMGTFTLTETGFKFFPGVNGNAGGGAAYTVHYFAYHDGGTDSVRWADHCGNGLNDRILRMYEGYNAEAVFFCRDNANYSGLAIKGAQTYLADGSAIDVQVLDNGLWKVSNSGAVNEFTTTGFGESTPSIAFSAASSQTYIAEYIGKGAPRSLILPFQPEMFIIWNRGTPANGRGRIWFSSLGSDQVLNFGSTVSTQPESGQITSVTGNKIVLANSDKVNFAGSRYAIMAFKRSRGVSPAQLPPPALKSKRVLVLNPATGYVDCGASDSLSFHGAFSIEFFGSHGYANRTKQTSSGLPDPTTQNNYPVQQTILWRSNGGDNTDGAVSYGLLVASQVAYAWPGDWPDVGLFIPCYDNWSMSTGLSADLTKYPWNTGIAYSPYEDKHLLVTHDGKGFWKIYVNGYLVKERNVDMALYGKQNSHGYPGHRLGIGARKRGSAQFEHNAGGLQMRNARLYSRELTADEVLQNYRSNFVGYGEAVTTGLAEEWSADRVSGTTLIARVNSENNGTIVGGDVL